MEKSPGLSTTKIHCLIDSPELMERVSKLFPDSENNAVCGVVESMPDADIVLAEYRDPLQACPVPELRNLAEGKPVLVIVPDDAGFDMVRSLFRDGATDLIRDSELEAEILATVNRAMSFAQVDSGRGPLLSSEMIHFRRISEMAGSGGDLTVFFQQIVEVIAEIMEVDRVSLMLLNERYQTLRIAAAKGIPEEIRDKVTVKVGEGIAGMVVRRGKPILSQDVEKDPEFKDKKSGAQYRTKGFISVPIRARNRVIGVLNVNNKHSGDLFDDDDLNLLVTICNQTGMAIDNARLFGDLREKASSLEEANQELRRLNQANHDLLINLTHEIRTPIINMINYVELLLVKGIDDEDENRRLLGNLERRARDLARIADRILMYFALQTDSISFSGEKLDLFRLIREVERDLSHFAADRQVKVHIDGASMRHEITGDPMHLREVFWNLMHNAIRHNRQGGKVAVYCVKTHRDRPMLQISVADNGPGISEGLQDRVFDGFVQTEDVMAEKPDGLGIGLSMSRAIVKGHGGSLELASTDKNGTTFTVTFPL